MSTIIYFAHNGAYFVQHDVIKELSPEEADQLTARGQILAVAPWPRPLQEVAGVPVHVPVKVSSTVTSTLTDVDDLLDMVGNTLRSPAPEPAPMGLSPRVLTVGGSSTFDACPESIKIKRMDEGFCVTHRKPVELKTLARGATVPGDEWKGGELPGWVNSIFQILGQNSPFVKGAKEAHGFKTALEVVGYVRNACEVAKARDWAPGH